jgi:hypothetical protein
LWAYDPDGENVIDQSGVTPDKVSDYIGREAAERLLARPRAPYTNASGTPVPGSHFLEGQDLSVGGEGMKGYYDKIVPTQLQKLVRPMDPNAQFETTQIGDVSTPFLNITPAMREKIKEGLPLFTMVPGAVGLGMAQPGQEEPREGFNGGGVIRRAIEAARKAVAPEDLLMGIHNTAEGRKLDMIERLGGLPAPSIAITKPSQGYTPFGDISLVAPVEMVTPGRKTPVFGSDVYSPRFPNVEGDQIFRGFALAGNRRYAPLTMENVLREMKGNVRGGEGFNYGVGTVRAQVTPQFRSLSDMQSARDKLVSAEAFEPHRQASNKMMDDLIEKFEPHYQYSRAWSDFPASLTDYARTGRASEFAPAYKDVPPEKIAEARNFLQHLRNMPTEYFEAKPQRAVPLSEFSGAVVPADVPGSVVDRIRNIGINRIEEYGDDASRAEALMKFVGEQGFAEGGEVRDDFDKGGVVKKALKAVADLFNTPEMEKWRGKSVIPSSRVEDRYFHGTSKDKDFSQFNVGRHGVWLTKNPEEASEYALQNDSMGLRPGPGWSYEKTNTASRVIPVFARAENPYTGALPDFAMSPNYKRAQSEWFDQLRSQGHDAWLPESNPDLAVILRDPEQIKSAISNTGEFSGPRIDRAEGGRLLEDQYPTHYLPNVGRQVMADGGETAQSRRRATLEQLGAFEDRPVMDPATMGENWASAVRRFRERPLREGEATVRPLELGGRDVLGGAIAGDGGIVRSRIADIVAGSRGLPGSGTLGMGVADLTPAGIPMAVSDFSDALRNEDYLSAGLSAGLPAAYYARKPIMAAGRAVYDAGARAVDTARDVLGRVPAPIAAGGAGAAVMTPEEAEAVVPVSVARQLLTKLSLPKNDVFEAAVRNTPSARLTDEGLLMSIIRGQRYEQAGQPSTRGGVFYLPEGSKDARHYRGGVGTFYGGSTPVSGETMIANPLFVKGATGGKAPQAAYDELMGKKAYDSMRTEALSSMPPYYLKEPELREEMINRFLEKYAPSMVGQERNILRNSTKGNQLAYALQESAVGDAVRRAGYDSVLGYSTSRSTKQPFISELFDVRERSYPTSGGGYDIWPEYLSSADRATDLAREIALSPRKAEVP